MQPSLPLGKRVADTSIQVYREIAPTLQPREQQVIDWLAHMLRLGPAPTAYELFEFMRSRVVVSDINSVRPRLCALQERGQVAKGDKRKCRVTGKVAYTWRLVQE